MVFAALKPRLLGEFILSEKIFVFREAVKAVSARQLFRAWNHTLLKLPNAIIDQKQWFLLFWHAESALLLITDFYSIMFARIKRASVEKFDFDSIGSFTWTGLGICVSTGQFKNLVTSTLTQDPLRRCPTSFCWLYTCWRFACSLVVSSPYA